MIKVPAFNSYGLKIIAAFMNNAQYLESHLRHYRSQLNVRTSCNAHHFFLFYSLFLGFLSSSTICDIFKKITIKDFILVKMIGEKEFKTMILRSIQIINNTFKQCLATASPNQGILFTDGASLWGWCPPSFFIDLNA